MIIVMIKSQRGGGVRGNLSVTLGTPRNVPILTVSLPDDEDDEDDGEMTLSDLYNKKLDDDEDGEDFVEGDEEEDDDEIDDEDEPSTKKPKVDGDAN